VTALGRQQPMRLDFLYLASKVVKMAKSLV